MGPRERSWLAPWSLVSGLSWRLCSLAGTTAVGAAAAPPAAAARGLLAGPRLFLLLRLRVLPLAVALARRPRGAMTEGASR